MQPGLDPSCLDAGSGEPLLDANVLGMLPGASEERGRDQRGDNRRQRCGRKVEGGGKAGDAVQRAADDDYAEPRSAAQQDERQVPAGGRGLGCVVAHAGCPTAGMVGPAERKAPRVRSSLVRSPFTRVLCKRWWVDAIQAQTAVSDNWG